MAIGVRVQRVLYDVDFTSLASQTLADQGASFTLDSRTWYQVGQNAGNASHSEIINGTGYVMQPGTGTYLFGIKFADLDPDFADNTFSQQYQVWFDYTRDAAAPNFSTYGTGIVDPTQTGPYGVYTGFTNTTPTHDLNTFDTAYTQIATTAGATTGVHVVTMQNKKWFEAWTGTMSGGEFPAPDSLTRVGGVNRPNIDSNVAAADICAGFVCNNIAGTTLTVRRMRVIKAD